MQANDDKSRLQACYAELNSLEDLDLVLDLPLLEYTYFKAGGPADLACFPHTENALLACLKAARKNELPITILGKGSNVLVADRGVRGVVILLRENYAQIRKEGDLWVAQAGTPLYEMGDLLAREGLAGGEFLAGIPGSAGGATYMNAGAYEGVIADLVQKVSFINQDLEIQTLNNEQCAFSYRHSYFTDHPGVISEIYFTGQPGKQEDIYAKIFEIQKRRREAQPLEMPSGGSSFKRPQGAYAAKLIADSGLKGKRWGQVGVSAKHSGFIVNYGGASASEIYAVFQKVRQHVLEETGFNLEMEVKRIGEWD
jgi:UDP-N-acetylmuramate dehydrogenase